MATIFNLVLILLMTIVGTFMAAFIMAIVAMFGR